MSTNLPTDISLTGLNFTRAREGRSLRAYQDVVGVWTAGFGLTNYDKGLPWVIKKGLTITEQQAEWYLLHSLRTNYLPAVRRALEGGTYAHPQGTVDGGTDFHYNTGGIAKATWPKALKAGDLDGARTSLLSWNKAGGKVVSGLVSRRAANWKQISAEDYGHLTGPAIIEPRSATDSHEVMRGTAGLLTAFPTDPGDTSSGTVLTHEDIPEPTTHAPGVLMMGDSGDEVSGLQRDLSKAGYPTIATGRYDQATYDSVFAFQEAHPNLSADGKVGPATAATLKRAIMMRDAAGNITKVGLPTIPTAWIAFHEWVSTHAANIAVGVCVTALVGVVGYYLWKHRHDAHGWINSVIGRIVP